jgi:DNA polymerase III alpha subunit
MLEDETGVANLIVCPNLLEKHGQAAVVAQMMGVPGQVHRKGDVIHVAPQRLDDFSSLLSTIGEPDEGGFYPMARADAIKNGGSPDHRDSAEKAPSRARVLHDPLCRARHNRAQAKVVERTKFAEGCNLTVRHADPRVRAAASTDRSSPAPVSPAPSLQFQPRSPSGP